MTDQAIAQAEQAAESFAIRLKGDIRGTLELLLDGAFRRVDNDSDAPDIEYARKLIVGTIIEALHDWDLDQPTD
jgi:hypothetical protein